MTSSVPDSSKSSKIFYCECCEYSTSRKSQYDRHLTTLKHKNKEMVQNGSNGSIKVPNEIYECVCGKKYKFKPNEIMETRIILDRADVSRAGIQI